MIVKAVTKFRKGTCAASVCLFSFVLFSCGLSSHEPRHVFPPVPSIYHVPPGMSQDRQEAARCFSAEAGVCDEWAGDCRKRRTGLLAKGLGSCWKKASFPAESLALRYLSFLFAFLRLLATAKVGIGSSCPEVGISQREKNSGVGEQRHLGKRLHGVVAGTESGQGTVTH